MSEVGRAAALVVEALELARRGRGRVEPNPRVGALVLSEGRVVGRGFHAQWGGPHAEAEALRDAKARGCSSPDEIVVTLEPCSARPGDGGKRQPPCLDAILAAGIRRVVLGAVDPDPRHQGAAAVRLRDAGVEVAVVDSADCEEILVPFRRWLELDRPWTVAKWAMSLDGKLAAEDRSAAWLSNEASRRSVHALRARVDGIVVGFRTACGDDPSLTVREGFEGVCARPPVRIIIDPLAELPLTTVLARTASEDSVAPTWIVARDDADPIRIEALERSGVKVLRTPPGRSGRDVDLGTAWRVLREEHGMRRILVEGGGALLGALWRDDLVDHAIAHVAPRVVGGTGAPTPFDGVGFGSVAEGLSFCEVWSEPVPAPEGGGADDIHLHALRG